jgi:type IV fimbrial biogenesis protein FimT
MIGIAVTGILATLATPSFANLIASQRARSVASELYVALTKARSEAIMRNANVTLSPKPGGWQNGWQILDPSNASNASNVLDDRGLASGATITGPTSVIYRASGRIQGNSSPSLIITATAGNSTIYQCVSVDLSGRPYMKAASSC